MPSIDIAASRCYSERVKKFILTMLLIVLPFQMTWAAAAQYCQHEVSAKASHFGHHAHQHQAGDQVVSKQDVTKQFHSKQVVNDQAKPTTDAPANAFNDSDCPYCHLGSMSTMVTVMFVPAQTMGVAPSDALLYSYPAISPAQPERPNWSIAS